MAWARAERTFTRDADATALWERVYAKLATPVPGLYGALTARAEAHILRLSVIYAALDRSEQVRVPHLRAAVAVWRYCEESTRYLFGDAVGDYVADRVLDALAQSPEGMSKSDLIRFCGSNVPVARMDASLGMLLANRRVTRESVKGDRGRPAEIWTLAPVNEARDDWDDCLDGTKETKETNNIAQATGIDSSHSLLSYQPAAASTSSAWEEGDL